MGFACPVCDAPQADGEHLANHLAFTAMLHGGDHADFLDAHVDDWESRTPPELAADLIHHADRVDHETVFEDTTGGPGMGHGGEAGGVPGEDGNPRGEGGLGTENGETGTADAPVDEGWSARPPGDDGLDLDGLDDATLDEETRRVVEEARKLFERGGDPDEEG